MKKIGLIMLSLMFISGLIIINTAFADDAATDPLAGMDTGAPQASQAAAGAAPGTPPDTGTMMPDTGAPPDQSAGAMPGGAPPDQSAGAMPAGAPPDTGAIPGMEGAPGSSPDNALLPDMQGQAAVTPQAGAAPDMGFPGGQAQSAAVPATQVAPGAGQGKTIKKTGRRIRTMTSVPKTNDIYTRTSYIGGYRFLHDFMDWGLAASSRLSEENDVSKLDDNIIDTAWIEGKKDGGSKQTITFRFGERYFIGLYEKKYRMAEISAIKVLNGYAKDEDTWEKYYRVKKMKITKNNKTACYIMLHDTRNWQTITLKNPIVIKPGDVIRAQIMEVFPETRRNNDTYAAITEFTFIGGPYGPKVAPKYIEAGLQ